MGENPRFLPLLLFFSPPSNESVGSSSGNRRSSGEFRISTADVRIRNLPEESHAHTHTHCCTRITHTEKKNLRGYPAAFRISEIFLPRRRFTRDFGGRPWPNRQTWTQGHGDTQTRTRKRGGRRPRAHKHTHTHRATDVTVLLLNWGVGRRSTRRRILPTLSLSRGCFAAVPRGTEFDGRV